MSENILEEIAAYSHERTAKLEEEMPLKIVKLEAGRLKRVKVDEVLAGERFIAQCTGSSVDCDLALGYVLLSLAP